MPNNQERAIAIALWIALLAWAGASLAVPLHDRDIWFHLSAGRWIAARGRVPSADFLTLARSGAPWIDLHWGFQLLVWALWRAGGVAALVVVRCALGVTLIALVCAATRRWMAELLITPGQGRRAWLLAPLAGIPLALALQLRPLLRPELLTFCGLALQAYALVRAHRGGRRWWLLVIAVQIALVNVQGLFILGWLVVGSQCAQAIVSRRAVRAHLVLMALVLASSLVNPYGLAGALFPLQLWSRIDGSQAPFGHIAEFTSSFARLDATAILCALLAATAVAAWIAARPRAQRLSIALLSAPALILAIQARRNLSVFALALSLSLAPALVRLARRRAVAELAAAAFILFSLLCADCWMGKHLQPWSAHRGVGLRLETALFPQRILRRLGAIGYRGRLFCDLNIASYATFVRRQPSLVDGRLEVLGGEGLNCYLDMLADEGFFERTCERFSLAAALIDRRSAHQRVVRQHLAVSGRWMAFLADGPWVVYLRRTRANAAWLGRESSAPRRRDASAFPVGAGLPESPLKLHD